MENFKTINLDEYSTRFPKLNEKFIQTLDAETLEIYFNIYAVYSKMFRKYVIDLLNLKEYDMELSNSNLNYPKVQDDNMDIYQYFTKDDLNYFYIRNNLYIERLSDADKEFLHKLYVGQLEITDDESKKFIKRTYEMVIFENIANDGSLADINYGPNDIYFIAPNNSIIIGVRYDMFNLNGMSDEEWNQLHDKQIVNLDNEVDKLRSYIEKNIDVPVDVIVYDDYSIKKKIIDDSEVKQIL